MKLRNESYGAVEKRELRAEHVAKETRYPKRDVDARSSEFGKCFRLDACDTIRMLIPNRTDTEQRQCGGKLLAASAQRGAPPEIEYDGPRPFAMIGN